MYKPVTVLRVRCWDEYVGALALDQNTGYYAFEYHPGFQGRGIELAPLALPVRESGQHVFAQLPEKTYHRLPPFIADSLPDDFGNSLINAWMAGQGIAPGTITSLDRLAYIGSRGMGALEYIPAIEGVPKAKPSALEMNELVTQARKAVDVGLSCADVGLSRADLSLSHDSACAGSPEKELAQLIQVGTSAGGGRAKAVVGFNPQTEQFISGQFDVPQGFEHWIIKFDVSSATMDRLGASREHGRKGHGQKGRRWTGHNPQEYGRKGHGRIGYGPQEYGRIEYAYYLMARDCGIAMEESRLYEALGRAHFMTKRFDRGKLGERHHLQTLCAMAQLDYNQLRAHDYSQLFLTARELDLPLKAHDELFRRMVFNVACSNKDDHTKNHSFRLKKGGIWELSPAYDITHAHGLGADSWTVQHIMGVGGVFIDITHKDVLALAQRHAVRSPEVLLGRVLDVAGNWSEYADRAGLGASEKDRVGKDIRHCCALLER